MKRTVLVEPELFTRNQIVGIEGHYDADYVCETCIRNKDGSWANQAVAVFHQDEDFRIPAGGSPWFGIFRRPVTSMIPEGAWATMIVNAESAAQIEMVGITADNGDVIYSHRRHDYRHSPDGSVWIDGGRDYTRSGDLTGDRLVRLMIVEGELKIMGDWPA